MGKERVDVTAALDSKFAQELRRMRVEKDPRLSATLRAAYRSSWTEVALAQILNMSPQGIHCRIQSRKAGQYAPLSPIPPPPRRQRPIHTVRPRLLVKPEVQDQLRALQQEARQVNGGTPIGDPRRAASVELSEFLAVLIEQGVTKYHLAQVLGVSPSAIALRLARHGYPVSVGYQRISPKYQNLTTADSKLVKKLQQEES